MKMNCIVDNDFYLRPATADDSRKLKNVQMVGNTVEVSVDTENQRSPTQLGKYWVEIDELRANMSEAALKLLLRKILDEYSRTGQISEYYLHSNLKGIHGVDSIVLTNNSPEARSYFDFAFTMLERLRRSFYG